MDRYIIGHTSKSYSINGILIPKRSSNRSSADVTKVSEEELEGLRNNKLFKSLFDANSIKVLDTKPSWAVSATEHIAEMQDEVKILKKGNRNLREELTAKFEAEKAEAIKNWEAEKKAMTEAWEAEKASLIAEATAEIERLTALIPKE